MYIADIIIGVLAVKTEKPLKDRYTLIERSNTLIGQSDRFMLTVCSQNQGDYLQF